MEIKNEHLIVSLNREVINAEVVRTTSQKNKLVSSFFKKEAVQYHKDWGVLLPILEEDLYSLATFNTGAWLSPFNATTEKWIAQSEENRLLFEITAQSYRFFVVKEVFNLLVDFIQFYKRAMLEDALDREHLAKTEFEKGDRLNVTNQYGEPLTFDFELDGSCGVYDKRFDQIFYPFPLLGLRKIV